MDKRERLASEVMRYANFRVASPLHPVAVPMSQQHSNNASAEYIRRSSEKPQMMWFFAEWCGHCRMMRESWENASKSAAQVAEWHAIDCGQANPTAQEFDVQSFPTVKRIKNGKIMDFQDDRTEGALIRFAQS